MSERWRADDKDLQFINRGRYSEAAVRLVVFTVARNSFTGGNLKKRKIEILSPPNPIMNYEENLRKNLHLTRQAERALKTTFLEAKLISTS